jgi:hypothetical protein
VRRVFVSSNQHKMAEDQLHFEYLKAGLRTYRAYYFGDPDAPTRMLMSGIISLLTVQVKTVLDFWTSKSENGVIPVAKLAGYMAGMMLF